MRRGEIEAARIECAPYDEARFKESLLKIRRQTAGPVNEQSSRARSLCAQAGVAFVLVPELPGTHVSFFHEAAHILLHGKKAKFLEFQGREDLKESEADKWASGFLLPPVAWDTFKCSLGRFVSEQRLVSFAREQGIAPGIVAGRYQRETRQFQRFNHLVRKLQLVGSPT